MNKFNLIIEIYKPLKIIWTYFSTKRKIQFCVTFFLYIIQAFTELLSIAAVVPFITAISKPKFLYDKIKDYEFLINFFKISGPYDVIVPLSLLFIALVIIAAIFKLITLYLSFDDCHR